jgi:opacity protein-like surface antigen
MKRNVLLLLPALAFWVVAQSVQAQTSTPVILGVKGGLNLGNASLSPDLPAEYSKSNRNGILAGGYAEFGIAEGLYITGEVLYAQMGLKYSASASSLGAPAGVSGSADVTEKVDYVDVPISLKYKFPIPESIVRPYVFAGPSFGYNVSSKTLQEISGQLAQLAAQYYGMPASSEEDNKDSTKSVDVEGHLGVGVEFEVSSNVLVFVDGRYSMSFTNVSKAASQQAKPRNIMFMAGVGFKLP